MEHQIFRPEVHRRRPLPGLDMRGRDALEMKQVGWPWGYPQVTTGETWLMMVNSG
jgi:hypothetical protein